MKQTRPADPNRQPFHRLNYLKYCPHTEQLKFHAGMGVWTQSLAFRWGQTIYDIHKHVRTFRGMKYTYYGNVNKRVRALQQLGYLKETNIKSTKAGFEATEYELTTRAYLALLLDSLSLEGLLNRMDEDIASEILAALAALT